MSDTDNSELDFVSYAEKLGYKNPMYLSKETKTLIEKARRLSTKQCNQARIEELEYYKYNIQSERDYLNRIAELKAQAKE